MRTKRYPVGLSADDLREIAKLMVRTERVLYDKNGVFKVDGPYFQKTGEWKIPVLWPNSAGGSDPMNTVGHMIAEDGFIAFVPLGEVSE